MNLKVILPSTFDIQSTSISSKCGEFLLAFDGIEVMDNSNGVVHAVGKVLLPVL